MPFRTTGLILRPEGQTLDLPPAWKQAHHVSFLLTLPIIVLYINDFMDLLYTGKPVHRKVHNKTMQ